MRNTHKYLIISVSVLLGVLVYFTYLGYNTYDVSEFSIQSRMPRLRPDYCDTVIPPNIAPLNFRVLEPGKRYYVRIYGEKGEAIEIRCRKTDIIIPPRSWRQLLQANRNGKLFFDVYVQGKEGRWSRFDSVVNSIAATDIDSYLVYRKIKPIYNYWADVGIYQRNLQNYDETLLLHGRSFRKSIDTGCVNCHSFCGNTTERMTIGIRRGPHGGGTLLIQDRKANRIGTKFGYTAWHPSGEMVVYSINKVRQSFLEVSPEVRHVFDLDSALNYYLLQSQTTKADPLIAQKDRLETYPTWSPDGRYLYFCSAPIKLSDGEPTPSTKELIKLRYDLMRIRYDLETDTWSDLETVLDSRETHKSISIPRISPDGRFLLFCMSDHGCFPIHDPSSDLYLMDIEVAERTGRFDYKHLDINSDQSESWHSFSSNSRWFVFSSRRRDGTFTRSYFCHIDDEGNVSKPWLLPQKDPTFYDSCLKTYSVPELIVEPVRVDERQLAQAVRLASQIDVTMPLTGATIKAPSGQAEDYSQAIDYVDTDLLSGANTAETYYKQAMKYHRSNDETRALKNYLKALELDPEYIAAHIAAGGLYKKIGNLKLAVEHYEIALGKDPDLYNIHNALGWIQATSKDPELYDPESALVHAQKAIELSQDVNSPAHRFYMPFLGTLAVAQSANGDFEAAVKSATLAVKMCREKGLDAVADEIQKRLDLCKQRKVYRE